MVNTYPEQLDAIQQQENLANITLNNFNQQQAIASESAIQTTSLTSSNQSLLDTLNAELQADQTNGTPQATITALEGQINVLQQGQYTLSQSLTSLSNQLNTQGPQVNQANAQHYLTTEQLQVQEQTLALNKNVMQLQAELANITADNMNPVSPVDGVVERMYVHPGDTVTSSTELAVIAANTHVTTAVVSVPQQVALSASRLDTSVLTIGGNSYQIKPYYISSEATDGLLYAMFYAIPDDAADLLTNGQYISVSIPVGSSISGSINPYVPIDAVYQTPTSNSLLVAINGKAVTRQVVLGQIFGDYIEITSGLRPGDRVILDRTIVSGDRVRAD
jgi:biotin carboxyl carrier protein